MHIVTYQLGDKANSVMLSLRVSYFSHGWIIRLTTYMCDTCDTDDDVFVASFALMLYSQLLPTGESWVCQMIYLRP